MEIQAWAETVGEDVRRKWESLREREPAFDAGYAVFYSPVRPKPELMIIGYNPGGGSSDFDPARAASVPKVHEYVLEDYRIAKRMRELFQDVGRKLILENSVKTNLIFFRSRSADAWESIDAKTRQEAEAFCFEKVQEMIRVLRPKRILTEGISTYSVMRKLLSVSGKEESLLSHGRALIKRCTQGEIDLIGMIHPTGARMSREDWSLVREGVGRLVA